MWKSNKKVLHCQSNTNTSTLKFLLPLLPNVPVIVPARRARSFSRFSGGLSALFSTYSLPSAAGAIRVTPIRASLNHCHPERSGPIFSRAPNSGASGREVEGSLCRFSLLPPFSVLPVFRPLCPAPAPARSACYCPSSARQSPFPLRLLCYRCVKAFAVLFSVNSVSSAPSA